MPFPALAEHLPWPQRPQRAVAPRPPSAAPPSPSPLEPGVWAAWTASGSACPPLPVAQPAVHVRRPLPGAVHPEAGWLGGPERVQVRESEREKREAGGGKTFFFWSACRAAARHTQSPPPPSTFSKRTLHHTRFTRAAHAHTHTHAHTQVSIPIADPAAGAAALVAALKAAPSPSSMPPWLPALVEADALAAARLISASMAGMPRAPAQPPPALTARLELITAVQCPRWHCDSVGLRAILTYSGPGTRFVPSEAGVGPRQVDADDGFARPAKGGSLVDGARAVEAAPGDALFLGGHLRAGAAASPPYPAAVHQSPPVPPGVTRLVLTVDDAVSACPCDAC